MKSTYEKPSEKKKEIADRKSQKNKKTPKIKK